MNVVIDNRLYERINTLVYIASVGVGTRFVIYVGFNLLIFGFLFYFACCEQVREVGIKME